MSYRKLITDDSPPGPTDARDALAALLLIGRDTDYPGPPSVTFRFRHFLLTETADLRIKLENATGNRNFVLQSSLPFSKLKIVVKMPYLIKEAQAQETLDILLAAMQKYSSVTQHINVLNRLLGEDYTFDRAETYTSKGSTFQKVATYSKEDYVFYRCPIDLSGAWFLNGQFDPKLNLPTILNELLGEELFEGTIRKGTRPRDKLHRNNQPVLWLTIREDKMDRLMANPNFANSSGTFYDINPLVSSAQHNKTVLRREVHGWFKKRIDARFGNAVEQSAVTSNNPSLQQ